jgi:hypothetical protein
MSTDPARLTDDEREDLWRAYESWTEGDFSEHMGEAVEVIFGVRFAAIKAVLAGATAEADELGDYWVRVSDIAAALEGR